MSDGVACSALTDVPDPSSFFTYSHFPWHACPLRVQHLAKEVVQSRQVVGRLYTNKAQLMSVGSSLTEQLGGSADRKLSSPRMDYRSVSSPSLGAEPGLKEP